MDPPVTFFNLNSTWNIITSLLFSFEFPQTIFFPLPTLLSTSLSTWFSTWKLTFFKLHLHSLGRFQIPSGNYLGHLHFHWSMARSQNSLARLGSFELFVFLCGNCGHVCFLEKKICIFVAKVVLETTRCGSWSVGHLFAHVCEPCYFVWIWVYATVYEEGVWRCADILGSMGDVVDRSHVDVGSPRGREENSTSQEVLKACDSEWCSLSSAIKGWSRQM